MRWWAPDPSPCQSEMELVSSTSRGAGAVGSGAEASPLLFFRFAMFRPTAGCQPPLRVPAPCTVLVTSKPPLTHTGAGPGVRYCATNTSFLVSYTVASFAKHFRIPTPLFEPMELKQIRHQKNPENCQSMGLILPSCCSSGGCGITSIVHVRHHMDWELAIHSESGHHTPENSQASG